MSAEPRYQVLGKIGEGGMGAVYRAVDRLLYRSVALKLFPKSLWPEEQRRARLLREARAAAALNHPNVCTVFEVGECREGDPVAPAGEEKTFAPGTPFLAMELVEGRSLASMLASGPLPMEDVLRFALQIAEGLAEAHRRNIVHRDLKPQNVMVTSAGQVKILDFGLAKPLAPFGDDVTSAVETISRELTREGIVAGTLGYMAPEQAMGKPVSPRSDVFSFGAMLYEMATGARPFRGETPASTLAKILEAEPEPPSRLKPDLPAELVALVLRCLRKKPEERYGSAEELVRELEELRWTLSAPAWSLLGKQIRRRAVALALVALAVLGLAAGVQMLLRSDLFAPPPPPPKHTQVTFTGDATYGALSPDGRFLALLKGPAGTATAVLVQEIGGGRAIEVFAGTEIWDVRWSPDGSQILVAGTVDGVPGVFAVPRLGGTFRRFEGECTEVAWSPDGTRFASRIGRTTIDVTDTTTGASRTLSFAESFPAPPTGPRPSIGMDWSPAGDWLVFGDYDEDRAVLWTMSVEGGGPLRLVEDTPLLRSPRWAPAGDAVYYVRDSGGTSELWKIPVSPKTGRARGEPKLLLSGVRMGWLSLARDGKRLLYTSSLVSANLWRARLEGDGVHTEQLTRETTLDHTPAVSPDGKLVAFAREIGENTHIFVVPIEGGTPQRLTYASSHNEMPAWSPDGQEIAFLTLQGDEHRVATVRPAGGAERVFPRTEARDSPRLSWAPGPRIVYTGLEGKLRILDPRTEQELSFPETGEDEEALRGWLSPDGKRIAAVMEAPDGRITVVIAPLEGGPRKVVAENLWRLSGWTADGEQLYALDETEEGLTAMFLLPVEGGERKLLARLPWENVSTCAPGPGPGLVCSVFRREADFWIVENFDPEIR